MQFGSNEAAYHLIIELYDRVSWDNSSAEIAVAMVNIFKCA